jgi:hypothetical protein
MGQRTIPLPIQRRVLERDGNRCQECGRVGKRGTGDEDLKIHHIEPYAQCQAHDEDNLLTLCGSCHKTAHFPTQDLAGIAHTLDAELAHEVDRRCRNRGATESPGQLTLIRGRSDIIARDLARYAHILIEEYVEYIRQGGESDGRLTRHRDVCIRKKFGPMQNSILVDAAERQWGDG